MTESTPPVRMKREGDLPLSFAQQRLWFLDWMGAGPAFNITMGLRLTGMLHPERLERALREIVRRHDTLRTCFLVVDREPVQSVAPEANFSAQILDRAGLESAAQDAELARQAHEMAELPFDLGLAPLFRARLLRFEERRHVLLLSMHHIVTDGTSMTVLFRELGRLYATSDSSVHSVLAEPPLQYGDYTLWQRSQLADGALERGMEFWRQRLAGHDPLALSTDRPRPSEMSYRGASRAFEVPTGVGDALCALGRREGFTLTMVMLAAWQALLARLSGNADVAVGLPVSNRSHVELEGLIGLFTNTLVVQTDLSDDPSFLDELLPQVRETVLGAFEYQDVPFQKIVEAVDPPRDPSRHPLFQVMLSMYGMPRGQLRLGDLEAEPLDLPATRTGLDLDLRLREHADRITGRLIYSTELFEQATIERTIGQFLCLLAGIAAAPRARLSALPLLDDRERQQLLVGWNATKTAETGTCVHQQFEAQVVRTPSAVAAICGESSLSYAELNAAANRLAHELRSRGAGPEVLIGLCVERSIDMLIGLLAILKSGAAYVPLDPSHPQERLASIVLDSGLELLVSQEILASRIPADCPCVYLDCDAAQIAERSALDPDYSSGPDRLAYVIYTSGSTGKPKGVAVEHRALANLLQSMALSPGMSATDVLVAVTTVSLDIAALELFLPLVAGARVVIAEPSDVSDGRALARLIASSEATVMQATPSTWRLLLEVAWEGRSGLRILCGGESLSRDLAHELASRCSQLWNLYGPTETTIWSLLHEFRAAPATGSDLDASSIDGVPIGRPIANTEAHVLDSNLQPVPIGVVGELYLGGSGLARGYWKASEQTDRSFLPHPFCAGERLYRTGDRALRLVDGTIVFRGRTDRQIKLRGHRIELQEIEHVLSSHPSISQCAVVLAQERGEPLLVAHLVTSKEGEDVTGQLRAFLQDKLPGSMLPARYVNHSALPLGPSGKIDHTALAALTGAAASVRGESVAPQTPTEIWLAKIWSELLDLEQVGAHDNFFDLGGYSLLATKAVFEVERRVGVTITPREILTQSLSQIARTCEQRGRPLDDPIPDGPGWLTRIGRKLGLGTRPGDRT